MPQPYIPSLSELTQGGRAELGVTQPGKNYGTNEGIGLLFRAATQQANMNWLKHQEIEARKADIFKNIRDLSAVQVMPADREILGKQMGELLKYATDPSVFNGRNEAKRQEFEAKVTEWGALVNKSKQDYLNGVIDRKVIAENPEYQNPLNQKEVEAYWSDKTKLGERKYNAILPTPKFDFKPLIMGAMQGAVTAVPGEEFEIGDLVNKNGTQEFVLNPNGKFQRKLTGGTQVDENLYDQQFDALVSDPLMLSGIKPYLDFQFLQLDDKQKAAFANPDGTPNYQKLLEPIKQSGRPIATPRTAAFDANPYAEEAQKIQGRLSEAAMEIASREKIAKWDNEAQVEAAVKKGDKTAEQLLTDADAFAGRIYSLIESGGNKIPVNSLSDEEKQTLGILKYNEKGESINPYGAPGELYLYIGPKGGIALATKNKNGESETRTSFSKESLRSARIGFILKNSAGKEYGAYGQLNPGGLPPPATESSSSSTIKLTQAQQFLQGLQKQ